MASQNNCIIRARDSLLIYELQIIIYIQGLVVTGDGIDKNFPPALYHSSEIRSLCLKICRNFCI